MAHGNHGWIDPEQRDADIGLVIKTGAGILIGVVVCMFIAAFQFSFETNEAPRQEETVFHNEGKLPPLPRLQIFPAKDLAEFKETQGHRLDSYGWADKANEIARVPVEKAEEMVLKQGLPVWDRSKPIQLAPEKPAPKPGAPAAAPKPVPQAK